MKLNIGRVLSDIELGLFNNTYLTTKDTQWSYNKKFEKLFSTYRIRLVFNSNGNFQYNDPENDYGVEELILDDLVNYKIATGESPLLFDKYVESYYYINISMNSDKDCNKLHVKPSVLNEDKIIVHVDYASGNDKSSLVNAYKLLGQFLSTYITSTNS